MKFELKKVIAAPIETVFSLLEISDKRMLWVENLTAVIHTSADKQSIKPGATFAWIFTEKDKTVKWTGEVVAYDRPARFATQVKTPNIPVAILTNYHLTTIAAGTEVHMIMEPATANFLITSLITGSIKAQIEQQQEAQLVRLQEAAETMVADAQPVILKPPPETNRLLIQTPDRNRVIHLDTKPLWTLGRAVDNDIVIDHAKVSRYHARIKQDDDQQWIFEDLNSSNGTWLDGQRIETHAFHLNDVLEIGHAKLTFE
ncbi:MAG: FHA domain-containing protein [Okeania sp. SIO3B3]|nr:FHA domain-containing protein [Okeania sp. SIO3B3]